MNTRTIVVSVITLLVVAAVIGAGVYVYNAGITQGMATTGKLVLPDGGPAAYPYFAPVHRSWGLGFGLFGLIFPLLFFFLIFGAIRGPFFQGWRRGPWHHGDWDKNVPPMMQEWHRKLHETEPAAR